MNPPPTILLQAKNLTKRFAPRGGAFSKKGEKIVAVNQVNFHIAGGESIGIVGESGCGKTTLGRILTGLVNPSEGRIEFEGENIFSLPRKRHLEIRKKMQIVFQDPMGSLNPRMRVGKAVVEPLIIHRLIEQGKTWKEAAAKAFAKVGLDESLVTRYPHELSGGQRQRVCIARALATKPSLLVADEPVASLDVSVQTQILSLFEKLFRESGRSLIMISHDVRVVQALCEKMIVMYLGRIVESGQTKKIIHSPQHPYTRLLIDSIPSLHPDSRHLLTREIPPAVRSNVGCPFVPRCDRAQAKCSSSFPPAIQGEKERKVHCFFPLGADQAV